MKGGTRGSNVLAELHYYAGMICPIEVTKIGMVRQVEEEHVSKEGVTMPPCQG